MARPVIKDRSDLINWIDQFDQGVTSPDIAIYAKMCLAHTQDILRQLKKQGLIMSVGAAPLSRVCTPRNAETTAEWRKLHRADTIARNMIRSREKRKIYNATRVRAKPKDYEDQWRPKQVICKASEAKPLPKLGPCSVFELGSI